MGNGREQEKDWSPVIVLDHRWIAGGLSTEERQLLLAGLASNRTIGEVLARLVAEGVVDEQVVRLWDEGGTLVSYLAKKISESKHDTSWMRHDYYVLLDYFLRQEVVGSGVATTNQVYACPWETSTPLLTLLDAKEQLLTQDAEEWKAQFIRLRLTLDRLRQLYSGYASSHAAGPSSAPLASQVGRPFDRERHKAEAGNFEAHLAEVSRGQSASVRRSSTRIPVQSYEESLVERRKKQT